MADEGAVTWQLECDRLRRQYAALGRILTISGTGDDLPATLAAIAAVIATTLRLDSACFVLNADNNDDPARAATRASPQERLSFILYLLG